MENYLKLLGNLLDKAQHPEYHRPDRTGTGTVALFGQRLEFDLCEGFPLLTTKNVHFRSVIYELLWFLRGQTNVNWLRQHQVTIWDEWADENGDLGDTYGAQWRRWPVGDGRFIDQLNELIQNLLDNPYGRRHLVSAWNPSVNDQIALPPCHILFQMFLEKDQLSCQVYQRSCDVFLGLPFNIASYALLTHLVAHLCGFQAARLFWIGGDTHLYLNHLQAAETQCKRQPRALPRIEITRRAKQLWEYEYKDIVLHDYQPHSAIPAKVAV